MAFSVRKVQKAETLEVSEMQQTEQRLLSIVDEQTSLMDEQTKRIQFLTSETEVLKQKLRSANERIEKLAESDLELQQSQQDKEEAQKVLHLAEEQAQTAQRMREDAETMWRNVEKKQAEINRLVEKRAWEIADMRISEQSEIQEAALRSLRQKETLYSPYLFVILSYSVLVTWFAAISSIECQAAWTTFLQSVGQLGVKIWSGLLGVAMWAAQLSQFVPDAECAVAVRWLIIIGVLSGIGIGVVALIRKFGRHMAHFCHQYLADRLSILIYLGVAAAGIFLAGPIQEVLHINPFWMTILLSVGYMLIRCAWIRYRST